MRDAILDGEVVALDLEGRQDFRALLAGRGDLLGRPVWICLPSAPEWRWMLERSDTPWYGSARLFRQRRIGAWGPVFTEVASALQEMVRYRGLDAA